MSNSLGENVQHQPGFEPRTLAYRVSAILLQPPRQPHTGAAASPPQAYSETLSTLWPVSGTDCSTSDEHLIQSLAQVGSKDDSSRRSTQMLLSWKQKCAARSRFEPRKSDLHCRVYQLRYTHVA